MTACERIREAREEAAANKGMQVGTVTRTRQALGSQIREALNDMQAKGSVGAWGFETPSNGPAGYWISFELGAKGYGNAGDMMDFLNKRGYDIRFGKS
jgi:hypothetical protein